MSLVCIYSVDTNIYLFRHLTVGNMIPIFPISNSIIIQEFKDVDNKSTCANSLSLQKQSLKMIT